MQGLLGHWWKCTQGGVHTVSLMNGKRWLSSGGSPGSNSSIHPFKHWTQFIPRSRPPSSQYSAEVSAMLRKNSESFSRHIFNNQHTGEENSWKATLMKPGLMKCCKVRKRKFHCSRSESGFDHVCYSTVMHMDVRLPRSCSSNKIVHKLPSALWWLQLST